MTGPICFAVIRTGYVDEGKLVPVVAFLNGRSVAEPTKAIVVIDKMFVRVDAAILEFKGWSL